ncbi:hypothetical protein SmJEL517_g03349 [Synchytrium microbalum]|uniref:BAR domain-containing protein n=1 Tax=Synchytrium microbalum TaxID=1806994 RepID=A0A507C6Y6_9FUNG|nr:uncharacterized protein SmJEL517_g03349 [Synchytrium microbalum]TPX33824.1 hypothetical protein SmJEL517_g03349 [Synchytrium microbalum]
MANLPSLSSLGNVNFSKKFGQLSQFVGEKLGNTQKTETSEEFKRLEEETDLRRIQTERVHLACEGYLRTLSKKRPSPEDKTEGMPLEIMGTCMNHFGSMMQEDSPYGKSLRHTLARLLVKFGQAQTKLANIQYDYFQQARDGYVGNLSRCLHDMKEYAKLKTKLENRRLDFDAKLNKVHKSNKEKPELEEATRQAQAKYEESLTEATNVMVRLNANEEEQISYLLAFLDAEMDYYKQCTETLSAVAKEFASLPRSANLPKQTPSSSSPFGDDNNNPFSSEPTSPLGSQTLASPATTSKQNLSGSSLGLGNFGSMRIKDPISGPIGGMSLGSNPMSGNSNNVNGGGSLRGLPSSERIGVNSPAFGGVGTPSFGSPNIGGVSIGSSRNGSPALPSRTGVPASGTKQVRVTFDFEAEGPDEMSIHKGDVINVITEIDEGWWEGEMADGSGRAGMFPSNYVEIVSDTSAPVNNNPSRGLTSSISGSNIRSVGSNPNISKAPTNNLSNSPSLSGSRSNMSLSNAARGTTGMTPSTSSNALSNDGGGGGPCS